MLTGIYIGKDCEFGLTDTAAILFFRTPQKNELQSRLYLKSKAQYACVGVCRTFPVLTNLHTPLQRCDTLFIDQGVIRGSDPSLTSLLGTSFKLEDKGDSVWVRLDQESVGPLYLNEEINPNLQPSHRKADKTHVGECLREWNRGVRQEFITIEGQRHFIGCQINTNRHMLIFELSPRSVYGRAARLTMMNEGLVFDQNIRQGNSSFMAEDNRIACGPLLGDRKFFNSEACFWNENTVYWSVKSVEEDEIVLQGCQGTEYRWHRPDAEHEGGFYG